MRIFLSTSILETSLWNSTISTRSEMETSFGSRLLQLLEADSNDQEEIEALSRECHSRLIEKKLNIVHLLDIDLRDMMVSTSINHRLKALTFLSRVLNIFDQDHPFDSQEISLLVTFYIDRYFSISKLNY